MNKKLLILAIALAILVIVVVLSYLGGPTQRTSQLTPEEIKTRMKEDYSKINLIKPGVDNKDAIKKLLGEPEDIKSGELGDFYFYPTPLNSYKNFVIFKNNIVRFAYENVFSSNRGKIEEYTTRYGNDFIVLYEEESAVWTVFLSDGVAVATLGSDIVAMLYFTPQSESAFVNGIGEYLDLSQDPEENIAPEETYN